MSTVVHPSAPLSNMVPLPRVVCAACGGELVAVLQGHGRWHRLDCAGCGRTALRDAQVLLRWDAPPAAEAGEGACAF